MSISYESVFPFETQTTTSNPSAAYLYNLIYIAKGTAEEYHVITKDTDLSTFANLDVSEVVRIDKAFDRGIPTIYLAITANGTTYDYSTFDVQSTKTVAFTSILSSALDKPPVIPSDIGVFVYHSSTIATEVSAKNSVSIYDLELESKGLAIFTEIIMSGVRGKFLNKQYAPFNEYTTEVTDSEHSQLKNVKQMHLINFRGDSNKLAYTTAPEAPVAPYVAELIRFNMSITYKDYLQLQNPVYTDEDIAMIEGKADLVLKNLALIYGYTHTSAIAPDVDNQTSSDKDIYKVNGVRFEIKLPSQILDIGTNMVETR